MKKTINLISALLIIFSLTACGQGRMAETEETPPVSTEGFEKYELAQFDRGNANAKLQIPKDWEYGIIENKDGVDFGIEFWPTAASDCKITLAFLKQGFGVCGTGLTEKQTVLGKYDVSIGTYDDNSFWDFIVFHGLAGSYVVTNSSSEEWWTEYGDTAMKILATAELAEGLMTEAEAIALAAPLCNIDYEHGNGHFDWENGLWLVTFTGKNLAQTFTVSLDGKVSGAVIN